MYTFHASASAYKDFWNNSFGKTQPYTSFHLSHCQIWQAFVQESVSTVASITNMELAVQDNLAIDEVTKEAFSILGEKWSYQGCRSNMLVQNAPMTTLKTSSGSTITSHSGAVVGVDENAEQSFSQDAESDSSSESTSDNDMDVEKAPVKMVVVDGICISPKHCAYENCADDLTNNRDAVFCAIHEKISWCKNVLFVAVIMFKVKGTQACQRHQQQWKKFVSQNKKTICIWIPKG